MSAKKKADILSQEHPYSKDSEMMVLGCMLTSSSALSIGADGLSEIDFYLKEHQIIFKALKQAFTLERPADVHLISEELKRQSFLDSIGGIAYLTTLVQFAGTSAYIEEYIEIVRKKSILRQMIESAKVIEKKAYEQPDDVYSALDEAQSALFKISQMASTSVGIHIKDLLSGMKAFSKTPFLKELQSRQEEFHKRDGNNPIVTGLPTGFIDLDRLVQGFNPSNLIILAARPSMGKTALAINMAEYVAFKQNIPVGIFSLEMTAEELLHRMICSLSEVESEKIKTGSLDGYEYQKIVQTVSEMGKHTFIIDDQPGMKITDLRARARRLKEVYNIQFMVVDYLQLLSGSKGFFNIDNRQNEISEISRMLKTLARELNIPILCLSQLSRKVEERAGHRPMLSDLRESGCLSGDTKIQDADTGVFYTIKELAERKVQKPIKVHAIDESLKLGKHIMSKVFYSGKKMVYALTTRSGRTVKASSNHPFRTLSGWIPLGQLRLGDKIAIPRKITASSKKQNNYNVSYSGSSLFKSGISRKRMLSLYKICKDPILLNLAESDVYWDDIISIETIGEEDVYDATVEDVHNFLANDILVHNSIEQDADMVMFVFRREYYNQNDKPGMAEILVAKNRHGSVGEVELSFRKKFAKFSNLIKTDSSTPSPAGSDDPYSAFAPR